MLILNNIFSIALRYHTGDNISYTLSCHLFRATPLAYSVQVYWLMANWESTNQFLLHIRNHNTVQWNVNQNILIFVDENVYKICSVRNRPFDRGLKFDESQILR